MRVVLVAAAVGLGAAGCNTPCGDLDVHAGRCGTIDSRYVDERDSVCMATRRELGADPFDEYATCVTGASCDDSDAIDRCTEDHFASPAEDPCVRYKLWAVGCGLEPLATADNCNGVSDSIGAAGFAAWVDCITTGGCPKRDDPRFDECQNLIPDDVNQLIDDCLLINAWTAKCEGRGSSVLPIRETSVPECLVQAQPFTAASYHVYATCLAEVDCINASSTEVAIGQLTCMQNWRIIDDSRITAQCERLIAFTNTCGSGLGGGSVGACAGFFGRFTPESMDQYVACIESYPCGDAAAGINCGAVLVLQ